MFNGKIIEKLLQERGMKKKELLDAVGWVSQSQLRQFIEGNPTASTLEKVADYFDCPIDQFFIRELDSEMVPVYVGGDRAALEDRLVVMQQLLDTKDRHIEDLEKMLQIFEKVCKSEK